MDLAFKALSDARRREILKLIWTDELASSTIASHFPEVSRPAISRHLRVLQDAGLVVPEERGTQNVYAVRLKGFRAVREYIDSFWDVALARLETLAGE